MTARSPDREWLLFRREAALASIEAQCLGPFIPLHPPATSSIGQRGDRLLPEKRSAGAGGHDHKPVQDRSSTLIYPDVAPSILPCSPQGAAHLDGSRPDQPPTPPPARLPSFPTRRKAVG